MVTRIGEGATNTGGSVNDDHLINHRTTVDVDNHSSGGLYSYAGNDTLEASTPFAGQTHMNGHSGNDIFLLDVTNVTNHQGHHAYGSQGQDVFNFVNIDANDYPITGRLDDFDYSQDAILIDGVEIDLMNLPQMVTLPSGRSVEVRIVLHENHEITGSGLGPQQFLVIDNNIFYALEGARDLTNGLDVEMIDHEAMGHMNVPPAEERHFVGEQSIQEMQDAPSVEYVDPKNFVPHEFYADREGELEVQVGSPGVVDGTEGDDHLYGHKVQVDGIRTGSQEMYGGAGNDVIDGNTGNDTIHGGTGEDALAGGLDNDMLYGGAGDDYLWGGDGNDHLMGGTGDDHLQGGNGDDMLMSQFGNDELAGGAGDDNYALTDAAVRDVTIHEQDGEGYDRLEVDGSYDMSRHAGYVEEAKLTGGDDANLIGNESDNHLTGNSGDNVIHGGEGDDIIRGWGGDDVIIGGAGDDVMASQQGADRFHFNEGDGLDRINDFDLEEDFITFAGDVDPDMIVIGESEDGFVIVQYGEEQGVLLEGITLEDFQEMAEARAEGNPIIMAEHTDDEDAPQDTPEAGGETPNLNDPIGDGCMALAEYDSPEAAHWDGPGGYAYPEELDVDMQEASWAREEEDIFEDDDPHEDRDTPEEEEDDPLDEQGDEQSSAADVTCFVATAAYQDPFHPDVVWLRKFRDDWLRNYPAGRLFISIYWTLGPIMARVIEPYPFARRAFRGLIGAVTSLLQFVMASRV